MKLNKMLWIGLSALVLSACGGQKHDHSAHVAPSVQAFVCENGDTATITQLSDESIELALQYDVTPPKRVELRLAPSGSGERYVADSGFFGFGAEWQQKGNMAHIRFNTDEGLLAMNCQSQ